MAIADDIKNNAEATFRVRWETRNGTVVPEPEDLKLANEAVYFKRATILYADLDASTEMVENKLWYFSAEIYKTFLYAASRLIRNQGGSIVSYDGDRVMAVFIGDQQANDAVSCALGDIAKTTPQSFLQAVDQKLGLSGKPEPLDLDLANQIVTNSRIAHRKFRFFTVALWIAGGFVFFPFLALLWSFVP